MALTESDVWTHLDGLTKPPRSLGRLEELAVRLCLIQGTLSPQTTPRRLVIFAADHEVSSAGVTAWPSSVTGAVVKAMCAGTAASTVLARLTNTDVVVVNVGTFDEPIDARTPTNSTRYRTCRIRAGARNLAAEPALTADEFHRAWEIGAQEAAAAAGDGVAVVLAGEMGIGNTTATSCLTVLLADVPVLTAVGRGAGTDDETLLRKRAIVESATTRARALSRRDQLAAMASVAGFEIIAMAGFFAAAAGLGLTIVLDGAIAGAAALVAEQQSPGTSSCMIAAHLSTEPSHGPALERLGLTPFLDWNLRLGEGTGSLLLLPLLDAAVGMITELAPLSSLGPFEGRVN